jgi:putative thioredoxin
MAGRWVRDVGEADFQAAVLDRSREVPVVVDFWAPWCGPCRALGPLLERLVEEAGGRVELAKVNTDDAPNLSGEFGVSGIPAVFALRDGEVVDQFTGLLPEPALREFLDRLMPSAADQRVGELAGLEAADPAAAERGYRALLASDPAHEAGRVGLARVLLATPGREAEAADLLRPVEGGKHAPEADRLRAVVALRADPPDLAATRQAVADAPGSAEARVALGRALAARGEYGPALDALLEAAELDKPIARGPVRQTMLAIFQVIGVRSGTADSYRARLQSLLY